MAVRGYAAWKPKAEAAYWLTQVREVLADYKQEWPLSNRQLFYRLVAERGYSKTEKDYDDLTKIVSRGRRAGYIDWAAIRDGGLGTGSPANFYDDADDFYDTVKSAATAMQLDRQRGQKQVIELWCEAGGMFPILSGIANPYSCRANTGGGYDSVTAKHRLAVRVAERAKVGLPTLVLHVGDFDGSGENMCDVLRDDAGQMALTQVARALAATNAAPVGDPALDDFNDAPGWVWDDIVDVRNGEVSNRFYDYVDGFISIERVALTGEQVVERSVITAPAKKSDSRTTGFIERNYETVEALGTEEISAQLEALTPAELRELVTEVIEGHLDMDVYEEVLAEEEEVRDDLAKRLP